MKRVFFAACLAVLSAAAPAAALEVRLAPADSVVLNRANGNGYVDFVLHAIAIASGPQENAAIAGVRIDVLERDQIIESRRLGGEALAAAANGLAGAGFAEAVDAQVLHDGGLAGLFGRPVALAESAALAPSTALVLSAQYFAVQGQPDALRVTVESDAAPVSAVIPLAPHTSPIAYGAPVTGVWTQQAVPTLQSHHRLNPSTEYAVDFFRMNENGEILEGDVLDAGNYFGFGAPVLAVADGVVVSVVDDEVQDRAAMTRAPEESPRDAGERIGRYLMERLARDFRRTAAGNLIVIRHEAEGVVEYSSYGHLRTGSARVAVGQSVRQGDVIGEIGDTGDSPAVHLHFQLNAGPDPFTSKSLPAQFANLRQAAGNNELGRIVVAG